MQGAELFKKNLSALESRDPHTAERLKNLSYDRTPYRSLISKSGLPILEITRGGRRVCIGSRVDPVREASRLAASSLEGSEQLVQIFGMGLGYILEELIRIHPDALYLVVEPDIELFAEIVRTRDLSPHLRAGNVVLLVEAPAVDLDEYAPNPSASNMKQIVLRPYRTLFGEQAHEAERAFHASLEGKRINTATLKRFDRLWTKNTFKNAYEFFTLRGIEDLRNTCTGHAALVIAAGPSVECQIPLLRRVLDRIIVIAVDTAVKPLLRHGMVPDFIVTVDPQLINSRHLSAMDLDPESSTGEAAPFLVADPAVYPTVLRTCSIPTVLTSSVFSPGRIIEKFSGVKGSIAAGGSVATAAFDLARVLGADPVFLTGLDLSYSLGKTHISGSLADHYIEAHAYRLRPRLTYTVHSLRSGHPSITADRNGSPVITDRRMLLYRSWFELQMREERRQVYNLTEGGLAIEGMRDASSQTLDQCLSRDADSKTRLMRRILSLAEPRAVDCRQIEAFLDYLKDTERQLARLERIHEEAIEKVRILHRDTGPGTEPDTGSVSGSRSDTGPGPRTGGPGFATRELSDLEKRMLAFAEPNRLISMVMQASISRVLGGAKAKSMHDALESSLELYTAMREAARFLTGLIRTTETLMERKEHARKEHARKEHGSG
jgi:hypothetical protein